MWFEAYPEWGSTLIVLSICIGINSTLPIWLRIAYFLDDKKNARAGFTLEDSVSETSHVEGLRLDDTQNVHAASDDATSVFGSQLSTILEARPRRKGRAADHRKRRKRERDIRLVVGTQKFQVEERSADELEIVPSNTNDSVNAKGCAKFQLSPYKKRSISQVIYEVTRWDSSLTNLAGFYMIQGVVESISEIVHVAIIGHVVGVPEANAYIMVQFLFEISGVFVAGFQEAIGILVPQADGCGNDLLVGRYLQIGIIFSLFFQLPGLLIWCFYAHDAIIWFGFDEETAVIAQNYTYSILIAAVVEDMDEILAEFLDVIDREKYVTVLSAISEVVSIIVLVGLAYSGVTNMVVYGLAETALELLTMFINIIYIVNKGWLDDYWEGLVKTLGLKDWRAMRTTIVTATPLGLAWFLTVGEWQIMIIIAQSIGPDEVAVWNLLGYVWSFFDILTDSIAEAAEVRVGFRMGAGKPQEARKMAERSIYLGAHVATITAGGLFAIAGIVLPLFTPNLVYQKLLFDMLPLIGLSGILMVPGLIIEGVICAQGRVRLMTIIEIVISWVIVIPLSAILRYFFNFALDGLVIALVIGYAIGVTVLLFYFLRSNWEHHSERVIKQNVANGAKYIDTDWDELPKDIQEAASTLGYTKVMWESNMEPSTTDKSWDYLTPDEKKAAGVLGYNKKKWNGESKSNEETGLYDEYDFDELPKEVKKAAKFLGITRKIWDNDGEAPIEEKDWDELTAKQQRAARVLGYTPEKWDEDSDSGSTSSVSAKVAPIPEEEEVNLVNYDDYDFRELPPEVQEAAKFLGYSKKIWDRDGKAPIEELDWEELTAEQQSAARVMGYTPEKWDEDSDSSSSSDEDDEPKPRLRQKTFVDKNTSWDMSVGLCASDIGGIATSMACRGSSDSSSSPVSITTDSLISEIEIAAMRRKQERAVKRTSRRDPRQSFGSSVTKYSKCRFDELPFGMQRAAMTIGFTRTTWDRNLFIPRKNKTWDELTSTEMDAALMLGCTKEKWEKLLDSW